MAANSDYELLTEHFAYPPVALLDDIINTVNVLADRALDSVERLLLSIPPQNLGFNSSHITPTAPTLADAAQLEIESGTHQLETLLNASIDKNFDIFELYTMRNILTVKPQDQPFMRLSHYEGLDFDKLAEEMEKDGEGAVDLESVTALRRRVQASQRLHVALETERAKNDALLRDLRQALGVKDAIAMKEEELEEDDDGSGKKLSPLGFLQNRGKLADGGSERPITTTTEFTLSQLQALQSLSTSLRTILPELGPPEEEDVAAGKNKTWRRERVEYVEGASRKYLENSSGLDLGEQGEVRDGQWRGEGRAVHRDEVEGLEQVVSILGAQ